MIAYVNPYSGATFFEFFYVFAQRLWGFFSGKESLLNLASDEIQVFALGGLALSAATLGCFLVLRRMTMLANALSHTILLGIVLAFFLTTQGSASSGSAHMDLSLNTMLLASLGMGLLTTFLTEFLTKHGGLQEDASIGLVFTTLFALGVILVTLLTRSAHIGTEVVMGNADALLLGDLKLIFSALAINLVMLFLFFKEFQVTTFDPALSRALGISPIFFSYLLMIQVSATAIAGFRAVGVLMVLAFMTGPALIARLLTHDLKTMLWLSGGIGVLASLLGVALSRHLLSAWGLALSTGGLVVCVIGALFVMTGLITVIKSRFTAAHKQPHNTSNDFFTG